MSRWQDRWSKCQICTPELTRAGQLLGRSLTMHFISSAWAVPAHITYISPWHTIEPRTFKKAVTAIVDRSIGRGKVVFQYRRYSSWEFGQSTSASQMLERWTQIEESLQWYWPGQVLPSPQSLAHPISFIPTGQCQIPWHTLSLAQCAVYQALYIQVSGSSTISMRTMLIPITNKP